MSVELCIGVGRDTHLLFVLEVRLPTQIDFESIRLVTPSSSLVRDGTGEERNVRWCTLKILELVRWTHKGEGWGEVSEEFT